jgi:glutamyl/glutaminyl-tRNA synthetase
VAVGRLAPTPSGQLHLGNALAFGAAFLSARATNQGQLLLRIEDVDRGRSRAAHADGQREDLTWLGLAWDHEVAPQSARQYSLAGIPHYRCDCTRAERLGGGCACRHDDKQSGAYRFAAPRDPIHFVDRARGPQCFVPEDDPILMTAAGEAAYPLAVVLDDARDGVTEVVRGADLLPATATQIALHRTLGLTPPTYLHVPILLGEDGKKLSKSQGGTHVRSLRAAGESATSVWQRLLPLLGLPASPLAGARLDPTSIPMGPFVVDAQARVREG